MNQSATPQSKRLKHSLERISLIWSAERLAFFGVSIIQMFLVKLIGLSKVGRYAAGLFISLATEFVGFIVTHERRALLRDGRGPPAKQVGQCVGHAPLLSNLDLSFLCQHERKK
jgi:hypothetical protein